MKELLRKLIFFEREKPMKVSRIIEAKTVTHAYYGWHNELQLTVDGGELKIKLDESSLRAVANVLNNKIAEQDEEKAEAAAEKLKEAEEPLEAEHADA
jgi:hypothetical protein|tara:strand:+ start:182 stop:475 length:294 start_codon:yes stop_codon:yes gene_type:complete